VEKLSPTRALRISRDHFALFREQVQDLQYEYKRHVVFDALDMLGYGGEELHDWVGCMKKGRPEEWVREYMESHRPDGPARITSAPKGGCGIEESL
jgi:hypothetical protein